MTDDQTEVKPCPGVGYRRDASWWNSPNASDTKRVHRATIDGSAACNRTSLLLNREAPVILASLPHDDSLCRRCFPHAGMGLPLTEVVKGVPDA